MMLSYVVAIEQSIIMLTLNRNELRYVRSFFIGWKFKINGIRSPNITLPLTEHPCK